MIEFAKHIETLGRSISMIHHSMTYTTDEGVLLEGILNGDDYATDRYQHCFQDSFDEEQVAITKFSEVFSIYTGHMPAPVRKEVVLTEYEACMLGFNLAKQALEAIVSLCKEEHEFKKHLVQFTPEKVEEGYGNYNPFQRYGVIEFEKKFRGFRRAYFAEWRKIIGQKQFASIEEKINAQEIQDTSKKWIIQPTV